MAERNSYLPPAELVSDSGDRQTEASGEKSIVGCIVWCLVGVPLFLLGCIVSLIVFTGQLGYDIGSLAWGLIFAAVFGFGGFWCLRRAWAYINGTAKPISQKTNINSPIVRSILISGALIRALVHLEKASPRLFINHPWIFPISTIALIVMPFLVWIKHRVRDSDAA